MRPRGRIVDGPMFTMKELVGYCVDTIVGYRCDSKNEELVDIIGMKFAGVEYWHRFFLDAGIGFWEEWSADEVFRDFEDCIRVDLAAQWSLSGCRVLEAQCKSVPYSEFLWRFKRGELVMSYLGNDYSEEATTVTFTSNYGS